MWRSEACLISFLLYVAWSFYLMFKINVVIWRLLFSESRYVCYLFLFYIFHFLLNPFQFYLLSFCFLCLFWSVLHNPYCVFSSTSLPLYSLSFLCYFSLLRLSSRPISSPLVLYLPLKSYISALISFTEPLFQKYFKFTGIGLVINFLFSSSISFLWQHFSGEWFLSVTVFTVTLRLFFYMCLWFIF